jgi:ATP-dependent Lon protease
VLPLRDAIIFPQMVSPLFIGRQTTMLAVEEAASTSLNMIALAQRDPTRRSPKPQDYLPVGVEIAVSDIFETGTSNEAILVQGRRRVEPVNFLKNGPVLFVRARIIEEPLEATPEQDALMRHLMRQFDRYLQFNKSIPEEAIGYLMDIDEPGWLADMVANAFMLSLKDRHDLLTTINPADRLRKVSDLLNREIEVNTVQAEIDSKVQDEVDRSNRENYLREQMRVIQGELGDGDPWLRELEELRTRILDADLPEEPRAAALKEMSRLSQMPPMAPEVGVIRSYLDWMLELPWTEATEDNLDVAHAAEVLSQNHFGLEKAKDRILEYIAVKSLKPDSARQPILCFVGPPGTGKTSIARSVADALGRKYVRISLGGVRDEAEIRGHRRTYIGALPGRILQTMRRAETINPLFVLDEVDKLGVGYRGDPSAALLEVLDPEQNDTFSDHYLELGYDLSHVMFITTANSRDDIPWALIDRMEVIEFPGYIEEEKIAIANQFLISRQVEETGLADDEIEFSEKALQTVIRSYTYEAGVRNLEREIGRICRKVARLKAEGKKYPKRITPAVVEKLLGPPEYLDSEAEKEDEVGVATSVAWTAGGGDVMSIEVLLYEGKGNMQLTGQIGEVMQESAQAALSYLKSRAAEFGITDMEVFENTDIHVHFPEGAIPKDGPSAGITIATAIISAFSGRPVSKEVGMTGEITLRGKVLPIGGVRNKVLAAHRAGLKTVILPEKNVKDLIDVPRKALDDLNIVPVTTMDEVLEIALLPEVVRKAKKTSKPAKSSQPEERKSPPAQPGV